MEHKSANNRRRLPERKKPPDNKQMISRASAASRQRLSYSASSPKRTGRRPASSGSSAHIAQRHTQRQRQRRRQIMINRTIALVFITGVVVLVLVFLTPIFNIQSIYFEGNNRIGTEELNTRLGDLLGENLFKVGNTAVRKRLASLSYLDEAEVTKSYFPPSVKITIVESEPCAYLDVGGRYLVIDDTCKILEEAPEEPEDIPRIEGMEDAVSGDKLVLTRDNEKVEAMVTCITTMKHIDILDKVTTISLSDLMNITFRYEDRMDVLCGSQLDLDRKIRLFKETVNNTGLSPNARGTIDLSVTGKAMYTP